MTTLHTTPLQTAPVRLSRVTPLTWIVLAAVVLRMALFIAGPLADTQRAREPDSRRYIELAQNLAAFGLFARGDEDSGAVHVPLHALRVERGEVDPMNDLGLRNEVFRTPGYPFFIALCEQLRLGLPGVLALQILLDALSVGLVYLIALRLLGGVKPAWIAAGIAALHPALMTASASLLSETLFTTLFLAAVTLAVYAKGRCSMMLLAGLVVGLAVLVRPIAIMLGVALAMWFVATQGSPRATWKPALCVIIGSLILPLGWMQRNSNSGYGFAISSVPPINDYFYTVAYMRIADEGGDYGLDWQRHVDQLHAELRNAIGENETTAEAMKRLSHSAIEANPKAYGRVIARSQVKLWTDHSTGTLMARLGRDYHPTGLRDRVMRGEVSIASLPDPIGFAAALGWTGMNLTLCLGMVIGAAMMVRQKRYAALLLCGGLLSYFMLATQATGLERFRVPIIGIQAAMVAAMFATHLPQRPRNVKLAD